MIDLKILREKPEVVQKSLDARHSPLQLAPILKLDEERRQILGQVEELKAQRNAGSKAVGQARARGEDCTALMEEMKALGERISKLDNSITDLDGQLRTLQLELPNCPHSSVPLGVDETENIEVRRWGTPRTFDFEPKPHWELGEATGIIDSERGVRLAQSRFTLLAGLGARLERALANYMLDLHTHHQGYTEFNVPIMVNSDAMLGTAQLPKFADDQYRIEGEDLWLVPTAEVPLTNIHAGEILQESDLPRYYTAFTPCFRREAGSHGKDVRGIMRLHQFDKVEMVKICNAEESYNELEKLTADAESVLQGLGLPYRVIVLCTGDMGFASAKTYDVEVWLPSQNCYREISSCSNCEDFQARRMNTRYRPADGGKIRHVHTLNGSGIAVGRCLIAVLENGQQADGSIQLPNALVPYMGGIEVIPPLS